MKFEINENKLEKVIFKYLDNKNFIIKETDYDYYFLENEEDAQIVITKYDMVCLIYYKLVEEIESFFSIETPMVKNVLTKYVENTLNIKVSHTFRKDKSFLFTLRIP